MIDQIENIILSNWEHFYQIENIFASKSQGGVGQRYQARSQDLTRGVQPDALQAKNFFGGFLMIF